MSATLLHLATLFGSLSLLAFGGGNGVIPDMQRASVTAYHWMTSAEFVQLFAISRAAPGPGSLIVALIGQKAAGLLGAAIAVVTMYAPSSMVVYLAARIWRRYQNAAWRATAEAALGPVAIGLTFAGGLALLRDASESPLALVLTAVATVLLLFTRAHAILVLGVAALVAVLLPGW